MLSVCSSRFNDPSLLLRKHQPDSGEMEKNVQKILC